MNALLAIRKLVASALVLGVLGFASSALANELGVAGKATGIVIHDSAEVLENYCSWEAGRLYFTVPGGSRWELVTSTNDPAISNPGDGSFHAFDGMEVRRALDGVRYPLARISAEVFLLPYPRRQGLDSAAGPGLILLSPGVRPVSAVQQHAEFTHELGHVVQYSVIPDADTTHWNAYRRMRGIENLGVFCGNAAHDDRPHEIFAEDFRVLFGDAQANYSGSIENAELVYPTHVTGLEPFMVALAGTPVAITNLSATSATNHGAVSFARQGMGAAALDLFDVTGRRLASVPPVANGAGATWTWDGRDASGSEVRNAVVFARVRDAKGGVVKIVRTR